MSLKLVGAAYGDTTKPTTLSGAPYYLFAALNRRYGEFLRIDYSMKPWQRLLVGGATYRPSHDDWVQRYHVNPLSHKIRSRLLCRELERVAEPFDLLVQVHGWTDPPPHPYVAYIDTTWALAAAAWPQALPPVRRERAWWDRAERRMYREAAHVFAMGRLTAESIVKSYGVPADRVTVVGGGVNFEPLPQVAPRPSEPIILFIGRDWERKGGPALLDAFIAVRQVVPDARLKVVGSTPPVDAPGVEILGPLADRSMISALYREAAIFCMPSVYEPYGFVFLEAMAHGVPCVGTDVGAIPEIVEDEITGLVVPAGEPERLSRALLRLLADPPLARRLGAGGRLRVETDLNWDRVVDRMGPGLSQSARAAGAGPHGRCVESDS